MKKTTFTAIVRKQEGFITVGKITSQKLVPFIGKRVKVEISVVTKK